MTENYSGSTKIREKTSMHKRHKFLFRKNFRLRNTENKNQSSQQITTSTKIPKNFQLINMLMYPANVTLYGLPDLHVWYGLQLMRRTDPYGSHTCGCLLLSQVRLFPSHMQHVSSHIRPLSPHMCDLSLLAENQKKKDRKP
jgi:hypothetical protein